MEEFIKVRAVRDQSSHWYIIPDDLVSEFYKDEENEDFCDSGKFDTKWRIYMTNGVNEIQLYVKKY